MSGYCKKCFSKRISDYEEKLELEKRKKSLPIKKQKLESLKINISDEEKNAAINARDFVTNLTLNKFVRLENVHSEKYGRILADVYLDDIHLNDLLLKERYAVPYDGGTKKKPISWLMPAKCGPL